MDSREVRGAKMNNPHVTHDADGTTISWAFHHNGQYLNFGICFDKNCTDRNTGWWVVSGIRGDVENALMENGVLPEEFTKILKQGQGGDANE